MPHSIRPGDVLAGRYRLVDLLTESGGARFWRAHDRVLERHVALHVVDAGDSRAAGLLEAARRSATILDRRILRVLDAETVDGLCYVVNEWGSGTSLDILVASTGPLEPRRAAWLVAEVADSVARAHDAGVAHGRLVPENVLVDRNGEIRVIGFSVDAAMHGLTGFRPSVDTSDLAGLLYCALTGKWAGVSASAVPRAPLEHGEVLRPRQVRAGIPRPLDSLCDAVLHTHTNGQPASRGRELVALTTAREISAYLDDFVGDPAGLPEALLASIPAQTLRDQYVVLPAVPEILARDSGELPAVPHAEARQPEPEPEPEDEPEDAPEDGPEEGGLRTQAGMPIFDDNSDDVSWLQSRATPAPPPPPFEEPPQRPLFAPTPASGEPVRRARPGGASTNGAGEYWPWADTGTGRSTGSGLTPVIDDEPPPGRSWLRLAAAIAAGLLLLVAIVVAYNLGRGKTVLGAEVDDDPTPTPSTSTTPSAEPTLLGGLVADDLDPQGTPEPEENSDDAPLAVDGKVATTWSTSSYEQQLGPDGLKTGVGLSIDLKGMQTVTSVEVTLVGAPTGISLYLSDSAPTDVEGLQRVASTTAEAETVTIDLSEPAEGRFLVVWLTALPPDGAEFRGTIAEVAVRGE